MIFVNFLDIYHFIGQSSGFLLVAFMGFLFVMGLFYLGAALHALMSLPKDLEE